MMVLSRSVTSLTHGQVSGQLRLPQKHSRNLLTSYLKAEWMWILCWRSEAHVVFGTAPVLRGSGLTGLSDVFTRTVRCVHLTSWLCSSASLTRASVWPQDVPWPVYPLMRGNDVVWVAICFNQTYLIEFCSHSSIRSLSCRQHFGDLEDYHGDLWKKEAVFSEIWLQPKSRRVNWEWVKFRVALFIRLDAAPNTSRCLQQFLKTSFINKTNNKFTHDWLDRMLLYEVIRVTIVINLLDKTNPTDAQIWAPTPTLTTS